MTCTTPRVVHSRWSIFLALSNFRSFYTTFHWSRKVVLTTVRFHSPWGLRNFANSVCFWEPAETVHFGTRFETFYSHFYLVVNTINIGACGGSLLLLPPLWEQSSKLFKVWVARNFLTAMVDLNRPNCHKPTRRTSAVNDFTRHLENMTFKLGLRLQS